MSAKGLDHLPVPIANLLKKELASGSTTRTEAHFAKLLNTVNEGVIVVDQDMRMTFVNDRICRMTGYRPEELIGQRGTVLVDAPGQTLAWRQFNLRRGGIRTPYKMDFVRKDGQIMHALVSPSPLSDGGGAFKGSISIITDISLLTHAKDALRESEHRSHRLIDRMNEGVVCIDENRIITYANRRFCQLVGYDRQELIGKSNQVLHEGPARQMLRRQMALRRKGVQASFEMWFLRKDGASFLGLVSPTPLFAPQGEFRGSFAVVQDITQRRAGEEALHEAYAALESQFSLRTAELAQANLALRESEEKYRILVESTREAISTVNKQGVFLFMNTTAAARLGGKPNDFIGRRLWDVFPKDFADRHARSIRRVIRTGQGMDADSLTALQGRKFWYRTTVEPLRDAAGRVTAALVVARDQTQQKQAEDALRESEEKYRQFFATETDALVFVDVKTRRYMEVNESACRLYGYSRDELMRLSLEDVTAEPEVSGPAVEQTIRDKGIFVPLRYHRKKDGTVFPVEISAKVFSLRGQQVLCAAIRDISKRVNAQTALRAAHAKLVVAREEERRRLSREMHDSISQQLVAAQLKLAQASEEVSPAANSSLAGTLEELSCQLKALSDEVRQVSRALYPQSLESLGLSAALRQLARDCHSPRTRVSTRCFPPVFETRFAQDVEITLFRIAQESVNNALRHAQAGRIALSLEYRGGRLAMTIVDNGRGFKPDRAEGKGLGLASIRERAEAIGADLKLTSKPGRTCVAVSLAAAPRP